MWLFVPNTALVGAQVNTLSYAWTESSPVGKIIIIILFFFSLVAWTIMAAKLLQIRKSSRLNRLFWDSFRKQSHILNVYDQDLDVDGCPNFSVYMTGSEEFCRLMDRERGGVPQKKYHENVQRCFEGALESAVAEEANRIESGMVVLALAVSGAPFLGLLGTVWGVMEIFSSLALGDGSQAQLTQMAPGLTSAMLTTIAGLLVAIPSMFGYNWLISQTRILSVDLDNFAQAFSSGVLMEYSGYSLETGDRRSQKQSELPLEKD
ncbi:MAG: MotA/TolQ/ExbB proton channel family protein [Verrucomicrobia bacterium]|nr:MotA/TolQ/ExbB proton channel family protein [Verrucomicrobiota bacterium]